MQNLKVYNKQNVLALTKIRRFETKMGECVQVLKDTDNFESSIAQSSAPFVLVGIKENIGAKANYATGNTRSEFDSFLSSFLNIQSNDFFTGDEVLLSGHLDFSEAEQLIESNAHNTDERIAAYRHAINTIDDAVEHIVKVVTENKKIPIIIGGGVNNAYGCIKGAAKGLCKAGIIPLAQINAINLDTEAGYLPTEGRHSGNAFRYADEDGYLEKYCVIGLHENLLPQNSWLDIVNNPFFDLITYEDIFLNEKRSFIEAVAHAAVFTDDTYCGIELNMNAVEDISLSSLHARQYINFTARESKVAYLHISGSTSVNNIDSGKLLSYLVSDFIKAYEEKA